MLTGPLCLQAFQVSYHPGRRLLQCTTQAACVARCPAGNNPIYIAPQVWCTSLLRVRHGHVAIEVTGLSIGIIAYLPITPVCCQAADIHADAPLGDAGLNGRGLHLHQPGRQGLSAVLVRPVWWMSGVSNALACAGWSVWPVRVHMPAGCAGQQPRQLSSSAAVTACADHILLPGRGPHQPQCGGCWEQWLWHSRSVHQSISHPTSSSLPFQEQQSCLHELQPGTIISRSSLGSMIQRIPSLTLLCTPGLAQRSKLQPCAKEALGVVQASWVGEV